MPFYPFTNFLLGGRGPPTKIVYGYPYSNLSDLEDLVQKGALKKMAGQRLSWILGVRFTKSSALLGKYQDGDPGAVWFCFGFPLNQVEKGSLRSKHTESHPCRSATLVFRCQHIQAAPKQHPSSTQAAPKGQAQSCLPRKPEPQIPSNMAVAQHLAPFSVR